MSFFFDVRLVVIALAAAAVVAGPLASCIATAQSTRPAESKAAAETKKPSSLPGGASSLQETFEDWVVACVQQGTDKKCSQAQVQSNGQTRERILSIEITPKGDTVEGVLLLPFGLALEEGVTLVVDDEAKGVDLRFRTCIALGCIVPLGFDAAMIGKLKQSTALKVKVVADNGQGAEFAVSLKGFAAALERTVSLVK